MVHRSPYPLLRLVDLPGKRLAREGLLPARGKLDLYLRRARDTGSAKLGGQVVLDPDAVADRRRVLEVDVRSLGQELDDMRSVPCELALLRDLDGAGVGPLSGADAHLENSARDAEVVLRLELDGEASVARKLQLELLRRDELDLGRGILRDSD